MPTLLMREKYRKSGIEMLDARSVIEPTRVGVIQRDRQLRMVWFLVLGMSIGGVAGVLLGGWSFDVSQALTDPVMWAVAALFIVAESLGIDIPFKNQRHTYSLSEIPAVIGLFYLAPFELISACVIGSLISYVVIRRQEILKLSFNVALQFGMVVVQLLIFEAVATSREPTTGSALVGAYAAVAATAFLSHLAVDIVISLVTGARSQSLFLKGLWLAFSTQLANASLGITAVLLLDMDWRAIFILLTPIAVMFFAYRSLARRVAAEEKARLSEQREAALIRASADVTALIDITGKLQYVSEAATQMLGIEPAAMIDRPAVELFDTSRDEIERFNEAVGEVPTATEPYLLDIASRHRDGSVLQLEIHLRNLTGVESVNAVLMTVRDVTDRRRLEERLTQAQKMDAIGQLAGGIAHDFNNLLAVIQNYASFVKSDLPEGSSSAEDVDQILAAGERASSLTKQLLAFARKDFLQPSVLDVNEIVLGIQRMLGRTIQASIEFTTSLDPELSHVKIDRGRLEQVLMNLAVNAKDAMPDGGRLAIRTFESELPLSLEGELYGGRYVVISVEDTGAGIDPDIQSRIFDPFFTTKPKGSGTGLGLSTAYGIVKQFNGHIEVDSERGVGTTFRIYLPVTTEIAEVSVDATPERSATTSCTILLAEDSDPLRRMVERVLSSHSYNVISAGSGNEAFRLWQEHSRDIDLLVTDVVMPKMSGKELSDITGLPTVFMSGYTDQIVSQEEVSGAGVFLQKPFTAADLLASVEKVVEEIAAREAKEAPAT